MGVKLRERPSKGWYVLIDWHGQRKAKCFGKNKKQAVAFAEKLTARLKWAEQSGEPVALSRPDHAMPTIETYLIEWLDASAKVHCKESTCEEYERAIYQHLIPAFGSRRLDSLKREDIAKFVATCAEHGKGRSTIRNYLTPLKAAYFQAVEDGLITVNPLTRMKRLFRNMSSQSRAIHPLTADEVECLLATANERYPILYPLLLCALRTGLRQSELIGLQWGDLDFHGRFLEVRRGVVRRRVTTPKNHKVRRVDLSPHLTETLRTLKETRQLEAMQKGETMPEWVFLSLQGGCWDDGNLKRAWRRCLEASELHHTTFHGLRHSFVALLIEHGAHAKYIQEMCGHSSITMTMDVYGHLFPNRNRGLVDKLDRTEIEAKSATQPQPDRVGTEVGRISG